MPGVDKNIYKLLATVKGQGTIEIFFAINGSDNSTPMKSNNSEVITLNNTNWATLQLNFGGSLGSLGKVWGRFWESLESNLGGFMEDFGRFGKVFGSVLAGSRNFLDALGLRGVLAVFVISMHFGVFS